jgi:hypothetical protein
MATLSLNPKSQYERGATSKRKAKPAPTARGNSVFLIVLYLLFTLGAVFFLGLIAAILFN